MKHLDTVLFYFLNGDCGNGLFDIIMPVITRRAALIILPFLLLLLIKERKRALILFAVSFFSILLSDASAHAIKELVARARPCNVLVNVHLLAGCSKTPSMPSSHAANAFGFAVPFLLLSRNRLRYLFIFIASLVAISRVFVGVHYPFDVLAGIIVGSLSGGAVVLCFLWAEKRFTERPYTTVLYVFLFILSIFRVYYITYGPLDLSPDEAHYWEWSRRLDLSYYSKGPMIAYMIAGGTALFGDTVFGVRIPAVVCSLLSSVVLYKLGKEMFDEKIGALSAIVFQLIPLYSVFGVIFTIDSPFTLLWIVSLYVFWKAVTACRIESEGGTAQGVSSSCRPSQAALYWLSVGITVGLGLLTKYTMAFFYVCALLFLLSPGNRRILKTPAPYASFLASLIVFSPVIIWNISHNWVTLRHTAGQAHIADGLRISLASFIEFTGSQLGVLTPFIGVMIMIALWKIKKSEDQRGGFLFWFSVPVVVFFLLKSLQGKVQANWAMTGYLTGIIAFSALFLSGWGRNRRSLKVLVAVGIVVSIAVTAVAHYPYKFHVPMKLDPSARLRGWKDLGKAADDLLQGVRAEGEPFIFSDSYQVSSELAFYMKGHPVTYCINIGRRMNEYDLWPKFDNRMHSNAIFATIGDVGLSPAVAGAFAGHTKYLYKAYDKGGLLREYSLFFCRDFKGMTEEPIRSY